MSNSETVQLTWRVILPGMMPVNITYDANEMMITDLGLNITTVLTGFVADEYIESMIILTVLRDIELSGTKVECITEDLNSKNTTIFVNISGRLVQYRSIS